MSDETLLGRYREKRRFQEIFDSNSPAFVAVYGRRRVGKTFLIREITRDLLTFLNSPDFGMELCRNNWKISV